MNHEADYYKHPPRSRQEFLAAATARRTNKTSRRAILAARYRLGIANFNRVQDLRDLSILFKCWTGNISPHCLCTIKPRAPFWRHGGARREAPSRATHDSRSGTQSSTSPVLRHSTPICSFPKTKWQESPHRWQPRWIRESEAKAIDSAAKRGWMGGCH